MNAQSHDPRAALSCHDFLRELAAVIETRAPATTRVVAHGKACAAPACREAWRDHCLLESAIAAWKLDAPAVDLVESVLTRRDVQSPTAGPARGASAARQNRWAAVATLLTLACAATALLLSGPGAREATIAARSASRGAAAALTLEERERALEELGSFYALWMQDATQRVTDTVAFVLQEERPPAVEHRSSFSWRSIWSESLAPFEETLDETFQLFRPRGDGESAPEPTAERMTG